MNGALTPEERAGVEQAPGTDMPIVLTSGGVTSAHGIPGAVDRDPLVHFRKQARRIQLVVRVHGRLNERRIGAALGIVAGVYIGLVDRLLRYERIIFVRRDLRVFLSASGNLIWFCVKRRQWLVSV